MKRSPKVTVDILFNLVGRGWVALATVLFTPYFIQILGMEAYGLLGFFISLQTILLLVDFGFSTTLNRALSSAREDIPIDTHALATVLERIFFAFALVILALIFLMAPWLAVDWLQSSSLTTDQVQRAIQLMGFSIALQLPFMLYSGGLTGLGRQVKVNVILVSSTTIRYGGGLAILALTRRFEAFLMWQVLCAGIQTFWARREFSRELAKRGVAKVGLEGVLKKHARFTAGVGLTAVLGVALTQLDKLILSKLLSLEDYGYYVMAWTLSTTLFLLAGPVVSAFFPRLVAEIAKPQAYPERLYHGGHQILTAFVAPAAALLIFFPSEILSLWVGKEYASRSASNLIALLSLGTLLNTAAHFPHALQLAYGRAHFGLVANIILVFLTIPSLYFGVSVAGAEGAAWVWVALNAGYVLIGVPLMHRWLLPGHYLYWLGLDLLVPTLTAFTTTLLIAGTLQWTTERSTWNLLNLVASYVASVLACLLVSRLVRGISMISQVKGSET